MRDQGSPSPLWDSWTDRVAEELEETRHETDIGGTLEVQCTALYAKGEVSAVVGRATCDVEGDERCSDAQRFAICLVKDNDWIEFCDMGVIVSWRRGDLHDEYCYWPEDEHDMAIASIGVRHGGGRLKWVELMFPKVTRSALLVPGETMISLTMPVPSCSSCASSHHSRRHSGRTHSHDLSL